MKKLSKILIALIIAITMIATTIPPNAYISYAENDTTNVTETYTNPMYAGKNVKVYTPAPRLLSQASPFNTIGEAGNFLKKQMILRSGTITFTINKPYTSTLVKDIFNEAIKDNGISEPSGGDYLYANTSGYSAIISYTDTSSTITYNMDYLSTYLQEQLVDAEVNRVLKSLNISSADTYTKIKAVHDYIVTNIDYDYTYSKYSAYNAIVEKNVVCQGFSSITCKMYKQLGIPTRFISGNNASHAWNIVKVNSKWYNSDNTWDENLTTATSICYDYFLRGSSDFYDHTRDPEYNTTAFNSSYPTSYSKYVYTGEPTKQQISDAQVTISDQVYTGKAIEPNITVKLGNKTLLKNTDFTVSYSNNINVGIANATIKGIGDYTGTKTVNFNIIAKNEENIIATGITTANLNVRSGPSTSYSIVGKLSLGAKVDVVGKDNSSGWFKIKYNNGYGYVSNKYLNVTYLNNNEQPKPENNDEVIATGVVTISSLNVRSGPSTSYSSIGKLTLNSKVDIVGKDNSTGWFKIKYNNGYGYVSNKYLNVTYLNNNEQPKPENNNEEVIATGIVIASSLNVRSGPSTSYSSIGKLTLNSKVDVVGKDNSTGWFKIKYNGGYGYVSNTYLKVTYLNNENNNSEVTSTGTTTASLNVRSGPSTSYSIIGNLPTGTKVDIVSKDSATGWFKIKYNGGYGYVSYKYIRL